MKERGIVRLASLQAQTKKTNDITNMKTHMYRLRIPSGMCI